MHEDQGITNRAHFKKVKACKIYKHMPHINGDILVHIRHYVRGTVYICACSSMCVEEDSLFPKSTPWFPFISSVCPVIAPPPLPHAFLFLSSLTINSYNPSLPYLCFSGAPSFKISSSIDFFIPPDLGTVHASVDLPLSWACVASVSSFFLWKSQPSVPFVLTPTAGYLLMSAALVGQNYDIPWLL